MNPPSDAAAPPPPIAARPASTSPLDREQRQVGRHAARRVVVTGAAGFIGSHLVEGLLEAGHHVVGIDAFTPYYEPAIKRANVARSAAHQRFRLLVGDLNVLALNEVLRPDDWVFHLAAQPGVRASWGSGFDDYVSANIQATQRLLAAAWRAGVARVVVASSSSVYGDAPTPMDEAGETRPTSPYGVTKLAAEHLCSAYGRAFGLEVLPLRFFSVYGARQRPDMAFHRFIEAILDGTPVVVYGDGTQKRDFTHVSDVVRILLAAAERGRPGMPVNVGGGSAVSVNDALGIIEGLAGRPAILERLPPLPGDARDTQASTERLRELADPPRVGIAEGLEEQLAWHLDRRAAGRSSGRGARPAGQAERRHRARPRPREGTVVLYSHDTYGLGHLRRNLAIAHAVLERRPETRVVMLTGLEVADEWRQQTAIELVAMPTVVKVGRDEYRPATARSMSGLLAERSGIITSTLLRLRPRTVLIDHAPLGVKGELRLALQVLREQLPDTWVVLGLRDILDDPATVVESWRAQGTYDVLESAYDEVLVYGSERLFDVRDLYELPDAVRARTTFTGYITKAFGMEVAPRPGAGWPAESASAPRFLVTGGGGGDAAELLRAFLEAWPAIRDATGGTALLIAGPRMDTSVRAALSRAVAALPAVRMLASSVRMLGLISRADVVVSMAGYNTVVEALFARRSLVVMPRAKPRREQLIRAGLMNDLGLARVVLPGPGASAALAAATLEAIAAGPPSADAWNGIDLAGTERAAAALLRPLQMSRHAA